jgi:hypothetical protein
MDKPYATLLSVKAAMLLFLLLRLLMLLFLVLLLQCHHLLDVHSDRFERILLKRWMLLNELHPLRFADCQVLLQLIRCYALRCRLDDIMR